MQIQLNKGLVVIFDDADWPLVAPYHWYAQRHRHTWYALANVPYPDGTKNKQGRSRRTTIKMHRVILNAKPGEQVDHDDGDGLHNSRSNIAIATHSGNQQNQHVIRSKTGAMGVYETRSGKFQAQAKRDGRSIALGTFNSVAEASAARSAG